MKKVIIGLLLASLMLLSPVVLNFIGEANSETGSAETRMSKTLTSHDPIHIDSNDDFASQAENENWTGDGTAGNPYIIENYDINASEGYDAGIDIENTDVHFVIRNCVIHDSTWNNGVYFFLVENGKIDNVSSYNNYGNGIKLEWFSNSQISNCTVYNNSMSGIKMSSSSNNQILNCAVYNNTEYGIELFSSSNNQILNCAVYNHSERGIFVWGGEYFGSSSNNTISICSIYNNDVEGIYLWDLSNSTTITNCAVYNSLYGIFIWDDSSNDEIHYCNIYNNGNFGVYNVNSDIKYQVNATYNWWGDARGPGGTGSGTGDNVSLNVLYDPWLTEPWGEITGLTQHAPISITSNSDFASQATSEGWVGDGTEGNPYIIKNYDINASKADGIHIENTDVYFIIRNCMIYDNSEIHWNCGIYLQDVQNGEIDNVTSHDNNEGISLINSSNNNITNCNIYNNYLTGLYLSYSSNNNIISACTIYNTSRRGIFLWDSSNNILRNNVLENNDENFGVYGKDISHYYQDIDTSNTINGEPIYYTIGQSGLVFDETMSIGYLGLISCTNILIENRIFTNNREGLLLANTSHSTITNCIAHNNYEGITLFSSSNNIITNYEVYNNTFGIRMNSSSSNNLVNCSVYYNHYGIEMSHSSNNDIENCNVHTNNKGIWLEFSSNNNIANCTVHNHDEDSICVGFSSNNNTIANCNISIYYYSFSCGISLYSSSNNNQITDCTISNLFFYNIYLTGSSSATAINTTFTKTKVCFGDAESSLTVGWYLNVKVVNSTISPISGATVRVRDNANGTFDQNCTTGSDGWARWIECIGYVQNATTTIYYTPHNISGSKTGYVTSYSEVDMGENKEITIALSASTQPTLVVAVNANLTTVNTGETSTITINVTDGTNPVAGAAIDLQSDNGGSFSTVTDHGDGTYTATFTAPSVSEQTVCRITANASKTGHNPDSGYADVTVNPVEVENHAPVVNTVTSSKTKVSPSGTVTITVDATDEDGNSLTYHYDCTGGSISGTGSSVTWTAPGTTGDYIITVYVNDGEVDSDSKTVTITVEKAKKKAEKGFIPGFEAISIIVMIGVCAILLRKYYHQ